MNDLNTLTHRQLNSRKRTVVRRMHALRERRDAINAELETRGTTEMTADQVSQALGYPVTVITE